LPRRKTASASQSEATSCIQNSLSPSFQQFRDFLSIFRLDSHFFQGCAKVLKEQVEVSIVQALISGLGMREMKC
jgi:hypothetical protein